MSAHTRRVLLGRVHTDGLIRALTGSDQLVLLDKRFGWARRIDTIRRAARSRNLRFAASHYADVPDGSPLGDLPDENLVWKPIP